MTPSFWSGRRVLLTGHTGFKGAWLALWLLKQGARVWGYALPPEPGASLHGDLMLTQTPPLTGWGSMTECYGDINDGPLLQAWIRDAQPDVVVHLAAQSLVRRGYAEPLETWKTNVLGSVQLLEALRRLEHPCAVVMVTTDKVYENREWVHGYREGDRLGGRDPYSASKAAMELAVASWRASYCGPAPHQTPHLAIATARAGNVIGGGDWARDRIVPDAMQALMTGDPIRVRHPHATRPWQHVLEPLGGYLLLAERLYNHQVTASAANPFAQAFNFGPEQASNRPVRELLEAVIDRWPGTWQVESDSAALHEAGLLHLVSDQAQHWLQWQACWGFEETVARTVQWYRRVSEGHTALDCCLNDLEAYEGGRRGG